MISNGVEAKLVIFGVGVGGGRGLVELLTYYLIEWLLCNAKMIILSTITWREQVIHQWVDDDDVNFILDQNSKLNIHIAC